MLIRSAFAHSIAATVSLALLPVTVDAAPVRTVPLKIDFALTAAQVDASCRSEIEPAGKRVDAMLHVRSARTFKTVAKPLENVLSDLADDLAAQILLFQVAPDKAVRDASEQCNTAVSGFTAELFARPDRYATSTRHGTRWAASSSTRWSTSASTPRRRPWTRTRSGARARRPGRSTTSCPGRTARQASATSWAATRARCTRIRGPRSTRWTCSPRSTEGRLQNPAVGTRYRKEILAPARTFEPDVLVRRFLGRPMSPAAFYADLGMKVDQ
jgi:hypothetical protein